jgi:hypothetical protein
MFKQLVVLSSLLAGTVSAGVAMYLQSNPLAFGRREPVDLNTYLYSAGTLASPDSSPAPANTANTANTASVRDEPQVLELPAVVIEPSKPAAARAPAAPVQAQPELETRAIPVAPNSAAAPTPRELRPCSEFRELGPMHVDDGVPSGVRGVRDLC